MKKFLPLLFFLFLTLFACWRLFSGIDKVVYQCDEYSYLRKSYFLDLYLSGKFFDPRWRSGDATDQTKLMEYVYGIPSRLLYKKDFIELAIDEGEKDDQSYTNYSDWAVTYGQSAKNLKVSQNLKNVLYTARIFSVFLTVVYILLACLIIFWLFKSYTLTALGFIFLITHPIVNIHGRQVLADSALNLFLTLGLIVLLRWWQIFWDKKGSLKSLLSLVIISGLLGGLAASTKLNGFAHLIISTIVFFIAGSLVLLKKNLKNKKRKLNKLIIFSTINIAITITIFIALHPNTWQNPFLGLKEFIDWRWYLTNYYQGYFPEDNIAFLGQKIGFIFLRTAGYMTGVGSIGFHYEQRFGDTNKLLYLIPNVFLFILGLYGLLKKNFGKRSHKQIWLPATIWAVGTILLVGFYLKLDWTRYYWPLFLPFVIINGYGLVVLLEFLKKNTKRCKQLARFQRLVLEIYNAVLSKKPF